MIKILHAADLHLDAPFSSLSAAQAAQRRKEQRNTVQELIDCCNRSGCDFLFLAGDVFDSDNVCPDTVDALIRIFSSCRAQVIISPGNHDCLLPGCAYLSAKWPENVHIFKDEKLETLSFPALSCRIHGAGFRSVHAQGLLSDFQTPQDGWTDLMVMHGEVTSAAGSYNAVTPAQIESSGLTYLALGHIHQASGLMYAGKTAYAWPGCMMGRGFDELGDKGAYLVSIEDGGVHLDFVPLGSRRYQILRVNAGDDPLAAILHQLPDGTENDCFRIILTGQSDPIEIRRLYTQLESRFFSLTIRDETVPKRELWQGMTEDTLRGLFLRELKAQYDEADETQKRILALAARLGTDAMEGREAES